MSVCIFSTVNQIEAGLVENALEEKGIENYVKNKHSNSIGLAGWTPLLAGTNLLTGNIEIHVNDEDVDKALDVVKALFGDTDDNEANSEMEEMSSSLNESENEVEKSQDSSDTYENIEDEKYVIEDNEIKTKKLSPRKKMLIFLGVTFFAALLITILAIVSVTSEQKNNNTSTQYYYFELFTVSKENYDLIIAPAILDAKLIKNYRDSLRASGFHLISSKASVPRSDLFDYFISLGFTPMESHDFIGIINNLGNFITRNTYQDDQNNVYISYFEKIDNTGKSKKEPSSQSQSIQPQSKPSQIDKFLENANKKLINYEWIHPAGEFPETKFVFNNKNEFFLYDTVKLGLEYFIRKGKWQLLYSDNILLLKLEFEINHTYLDGVYEIFDIEKSNSHFTFYTSNYFSNYPSETTYYVPGFNTQNNNPLNNTIINSKQLYREYIENQERANNLYNSKIFRVTGTILNITLGIESHCVELSGDDKSSIVYVYLRESEYYKITNYKKGQTINIIGKCNGFTFLDSFTITGAIIDD